jgi:hypothetical protein
VAGRRPPPFGTVRFRRLADSPAWSLPSHAARLTASGWEVPAEVVILVHRSSELRGSRRPRLPSLPSRVPGASVAGSRARLRIGGEVRDAGPVRGDPAGTLRAAAAVLAAVGERLRPGDRVLAGSSCHVPADPGEVVAEIDGLGAVGAQLSP